MKKIILFFSVFAAIPLFAHTNLIQNNDKLIRLNFELPEITQDHMTINGITYTRFSYAANRYLTDAGAPIIPYSIEHIAIPPGAEPEVQFQINEQSEIRPVTVLPATVYSGIREPATIPLNDSIYSSAAAFPGRVVEISEPYEYRNMQVIDLKIYPIQYYPQGNRVQIYKKLSVQINLSGGHPGTGSAIFSTMEKDFLKNRLINYEQSKNYVVPQSSRLQKTAVNYDFSTGEWYKIPITQEGIYQITGSFLSSRGINISNVDVATIQMFNYGGAPLSYRALDSIPSGLNEIAIDVRDNNGDGILNENDLIYFYGRGINGWRIDPSSTDAHPWESYHHPYATKNYYLITFNQSNGKRIARQNSIDEGSPARPTSFMDHYHFETDNYNLLQSGLDWYWIKLLGTNDQTTLNFGLPQNIADGKTKIVFKVKNGSDVYSISGPTINLNASINGTHILTYQGLQNTHTELQSKEEASLFAIHGGSNELSLQHSSSDDGAQTCLDYFEVYCQRPFQAENNYLKINYVLDNNTPTEYQVTNLSQSGNRVWDISDFANIREINPLQNNAMVIFQDKAATRSPKEYMVFANAAIKTVQQMEIVRNSPNLRDPSRKGKLLIIVPDEFYDATEPLETLKESQFPDPIETERIMLSEIFREFSSCVYDPTAIRNFIKYAYYNWRSSADAYPEFVMLMGDGSYDYKGIVLDNYINRIPTFQITGSYDLSSRESDQYYADLNSTSLGILNPELAIGRITVNSLNEVDNFVEKLTNYQKSYLINPEENGWQNTLTFVADDEIAGQVSGEWLHMRDTESLIGYFIPTKFDIKKIYLVNYETQAGGLTRIKPQATEAFINQLNRGTMIINYFGHGNPDTWAHEQVFVRSRDLGKVNNEGKLPLWVAATCDWARFDDPTRNSMAEEMLWLKNKGAIGVIAASRAVYASSNKALADSFYGSLFNNKSNTLPSKIIGYAWLASLGGGANDQKFHLLGDPTMKLADPQNLITITSVTPDTLKALSTVTVSAQITDLNHNPLSDFQGEALVRVFDTKDTLTAHSGSIRYTKQESGIFKGVVSVTNGELTGKFIVPKSIKYDHTPNGRITIYAWSENGGDADGFRNDLTLFGTESLSDNQGPTLDFSFQGQEDFFDGDYVERQPTVIVRLSDESGINLTQEVGHRIELSIDGKLKKDITEYFIYDKNSYQSGQLQYTLPALAPGNHVLTISAWDNVNNLSEREVNFRTIQVNELALEQVVNYPNPFEEDTHFTFQFQSPTNFGDVTIKIYTVTGRLIQEIETIARPGFNKVYWDGRDRDGDKLANGVYLYKIIIDDGQRSIEKIEKLAVLR